jgi:DNA gyrase subunit A
MMIDLLKIVDESFSTYAAMTIMDRAIVDARDGLKPAARQCMYAQKLDKITYKKPFKKSTKSVASAMDHFYVHGDASCYALLTRLAKSFSMRYPLEDFDGSYGTISGGDTEAAARYTEMRLGELGSLLYDGIEKDCITTWFNNYDDTEQFPSVVPSLGFYNICNGSLGLATGMAASIPQFNLCEVNEAMIKLLWNPDIDFDEIYCAPDFCTGATILNADVVKESLRNGHGKAAIIRSNVEYDTNENCIYITEIPYGVYTGTIINQIKNAVESGELIGIKKVDDLSTRKANIKILLEKNINCSNVIKKLYKLTSVQDSYTINMTMLDKGSRPRIFGWRDALQAHLDHEIEVRTKIHQYDLQKIAARIHIIDGLLLAIANIDEVVKIIKISSNKDIAKKNLIDRFNFSDVQADAILKMTLSRLINLEVQSYKDEREKLLAEQISIQSILDNKELLFKEIEDGLRAVEKKFGDARRTRLMNLDYKNDESDAEPIEKKELLIHFTNLGNIYTQESTTLMTTRRGGKGSKIKLANNEAIMQTINDTNFSSLLVFSNKGKMYSLSIDDLPINSKVNVAQFFNFEAGEHITTATSIARKSEVKYFVFVTKNGMIKKTKASEYEHKRGKSLKAINLKDDDEVINVHFVNDEKIGILTSEGNFVIIETEEINSIGRTTSGVRAIKLGAEDVVISSHVICRKDNMLITISRSGLAKKTALEEFPVCNRGIKGKKISGTRNNDFIVDFLTISEDSDIISISNRGTIKFNTYELRNLSRDATGVKAITLNDGDYIVDLIRG